MRAVLLAVIAAASTGAIAHAADWKPYAPGPNGAQWFYDAGYSYRDAESGRIVVMQAIGKPEAHLGPNGPGAADGVGLVVALDCKANDLVVVTSYSPKKPGDLTATAWRKDKPKKIGSKDVEDRALMTAACAGADQLPTK